MSNVPLAIGSLVTRSIDRYALVRARGTPAGSEQGFVTLDRYHASTSYSEFDDHADVDRFEPGRGANVQSLGSDAGKSKIGAEAQRSMSAPEMDAISEPDVAPAGANPKFDFLDEGRSATLAAGLRWTLSFVFILSLYVGATVYLMRPTQTVVDGNPTDAINIEMVSDPSTETDKADDAPGPKVVESTAPTSEMTDADDPDPPAPDSAPPTEAKRELQKTLELTAPPAQVDADAVLPPPEKMVEEKPPELKEPVEKTPDAKEDTKDRKTAASRASTGSAALLSGGRRPSAAALATWRGEIGTHLVHHRRYPQEARSMGWQGTARVRVTINEDGHVLHSEMMKSTGRPLLDDEALALMQRSDPFPKPPPGMPAPIVMTVPVNFSIR